MHAQEQRKYPGTSERPRRPATVVPAVAPTVSPSAGAGMTAGGILSLQRRAGNSAVARAVGTTRHQHSAGDGHAAEPPTGAPVIQRAAWTFNSSTRTHDATGQQSPGLWQDREDPSRTTTSAQLGLGPHTPEHGDQYDDATKRLFSSGNAAISKRGKFENYKAHETRFRHALVEAKRRIATALDLLQTAGDQPSGRTLHALKLSFPGFQSASAADIARFLPRIIEVIRRVQTGLNASGAKFALVGETSILDVGATMATRANAVGWVAPTARDFTDRLKPNYMKTEDLPETAARSGPINLKPRGENAWFIIHEATHRFSGTLDYQYSSYDHEIGEDKADLGLAEHMGMTPDELAQHSAGRLRNRVAGDPKQYTGKDESAQPLKQTNWYAMGKRALMNADSYAQFVLTASGEPLPRPGSSGQ
jgi:hypothetical protein